jgi:hypothetical protein
LLSNLFIITIIYFLYQNKNKIWLNISTIIVSIFLFTTGLFWFGQFWHQVVPTSLPIAVVWDRTVAFPTKFSGYCVYSFESHLTCHVCYKHHFFFVRVIIHIIII